MVQAPAQKEGTQICRAPESCGHVGWHHSSPRAEPGRARACWRAASHPPGLTSTPTFTGLVGLVSLALQAHSFPLPEVQPSLPQDVRAPSLQGALMTSYLPTSGQYPVS